MRNPKILVGAIVAVLVFALAWFLFFRPSTTTVEDQALPTVPSAPPVPGAGDGTGTLDNPFGDTPAPAPTTAPLDDQYADMTLEEVTLSYNPSPADIEVSYIWVRDNATTLNVFSTKLDEAYIGFEQVEKPSDFSKYTKNLTDANEALKQLAATSPDPVIAKATTLLSASISRAVNHLGEAGQYGLNAEQENLTEAERNAEIDKWGESYTLFLEESATVQSLTSFLYGYMDSLTNPEIIESGKLG